MVVIKMFAIVIGVIIVTALVIVGSVKFWRKIDKDFHEWHKNNMDDK